MPFPYSVEKIRNILDLTEVNKEQSEIFEDLYALFLSYVSLADKELQMFALEAIADDMSGDQLILRNKVNEIINTWH